MTKKMNIPFSPPDVTEEEAREVCEALLSGWITTGPRVKELERQIAKMCHIGMSDAQHPNVVCLASATASMEMAYRLIGIKPGDEVIVPAYTYTATASSVVHTGGKLIMCDCQPGSFEMDYEQLAKLITPRTKVIAAVDLAGLVCDYKKIYDIINRPEIKAKFKAESEIQELYGRVILLADCAHAFGSKRVYETVDGVDHWMMAGEIADFSAFSFHAVKNFTTAEGGALTWRLPNVNGNANGNENDNVNVKENAPDGVNVYDSCQEYADRLNALLYKKLQLLSLHGQSKDAFAKTQLGAWEYDVVGAYYKANMTDIMGAIGLVQMRRYPEMLARREKIIRYYDGRLKELIDAGRVQVLHHFSDIQHSNGHLYQVRLLGKDEAYRNAVITKMAEMGVATNVHFKPLPMMTAYKEFGFDIKDFPNAYDYYQNEITLPLFSRLTDEQAEYVMDCFIETLTGML